MAYRAAVVVELEAKLVKALGMERVDLKVNLTEPITHEADYRRVIMMLEMSVKDEIVISESQFRQYVLDEWQWKSAFDSVVGSYKTR